MEREVAEEGMAREPTPAVVGRPHHDRAARGRDRGGERSAYAVHTVFAFTNSRMPHTPSSRP